MRELIEEHYREHRKMLVGRFGRASGSEADGQDIVQEGYTRALKYSHSYNPSKSFDSWIGTIMYNVLKDFKNDRGGLTSDVDPDTLETPSTHSGADYDRLVDDLMKHLKDDHKEVVELHYKCGYKPREIGQVVDLSITNITTILNRFKMLATNGGF